MPLAIALAFLVGAVCAVRLPVLIFTLVVALVVFVFGIINYGIGNPLVSSALWALAYAAALEAGYVFAHCLFYLLYVRRSIRHEKQAPNEIRSKYTSK